MCPSSSKSTDANPRTEDSRHAILRAAIVEFSEQGEAGARTDAIAKAAGVNKALIHYYFGTKDGLYGAVLEEVFTGLLGGFLQGLQGPGTAGERLLQYFLVHFDNLAGAGAFTRLMGHEMMRARAGEPSRVTRIVELAFGPLYQALLATVAEGIRTGELRDLEPGRTLQSLIGANTFYFISAPFFREISGHDPREPRMLARQRAALLDFAATVLFADPALGRQAGARILAEHPQPSVPKGASK